MNSQIRNRNTFIFIYTYCSEGFSEGFTPKVLESMQTIFNCCPTIMHYELLNHVQLRKVDKDSLLIGEGDICDGIYIVIEGSMKLYIKKEKGDQVFLYSTTNDVIGIQSVISNSTFNYNASAIEDSVLAFLPIGQVKKILAKYPNAFFSLMKKVNQKALAIETRSSLLFTDCAEKVVVKTMEDLNDRFGTDTNGYIKIHIPVKDLASYVCMSKTNLYRVLQTLKEKTILTHHLDRYRLEKPRQLHYNFMHKVV